MINLWLVDDEVLFAQGLGVILSKEEDLKVSQSFNSSHDFLAAWKNPDVEKPDIILLDINLPKVDGIKLTLEIFKQKTDTKVIGLSSHYSKTLISKMVKLGASSYLPKNVSIAKLLCTIRRVNSEGFYFDDIQLIGLKKSDLNDQEKKTMLLHGLTDRELDVLGLICEQCTTDQIAEKLFISNKTVERHRSNLFEKTKVKNVVGLVLFALQHKLVERQFMS